MNFTTIEQSKQLLEARYSPSTADAVYRPWTRSAKGYDFICAYKRSTIVFQQLDDIPAWSLSALWDMCKDEPLSFATMEDRAEDILNFLVKHLIKIKK